MLFAVEISGWSCFRASSGSSGASCPVDNDIQLQVMKGGVRFVCGLRAQRRALQQNRLGPKKRRPLIYNRSDKDGDSVDKKTWQLQTGGS